MASKDWISSRKLFGKVPEIQRNCVRAKVDHLVRSGEIESIPDPQDKRLSLYRLRDGGSDASL